MGKKYEPVPNERRRQLIQLIHEQGMQIIQAAEVLDIYYPTAKAINMVYTRVGRIDKKAHRAKRVTR